MDQQRPPGHDALDDDGSGQTRDRVAADIRDNVENSLSQAQDRAETGKNRAAAGVDHATQALRGAAERLQAQEPWLAGLVSSGAEELAQLADTLRANDLRSVLSRTDDLARRQPMLVAGAAFAAGFAAIRAVRSMAAPAADTLADVASDAMTMARREASHAMSAAQGTAVEFAGSRPQQRAGEPDSENRREQRSSDEAGEHSADQPRSARWDNAGADARRTSLGH